MSPVRSLFHTIHLWLGLASGIVLFIVCFTGTLYVFQNEIQRMINPEKYIVVSALNQAPKPISNLVQLVEQQTGAKVIGFTVSTHPTEAYAFQGKKKGEEGRGTKYYINPYTAEILGTGNDRPAGFFLGVMKLHRYLLLNTKIGRPIVGIATIIFFFICISGIVIWIPRKLKDWKRRFSVQFKGNWKRTNHDWHSAMGIYSAPLLIILALTGLCWSFVWYQQGVSKVIGAEIFKARNEKPLSVASDPTDMPLPQLEEFINAANQLSKGEGMINVSLPKDSATAMLVTKTKSGAFTLASTDKMQFNARNGELLRMDRFDELRFNQKVAAMVKPLHTGEFFGLTSKIGYFIVCLIATTLPVTGAMIWWNKRRKKAFIH